MLSTHNSKKYKSWFLAFAAFVYTSLCIQVAKADDIDIYTNAVNFGTGGEPVMTFVIDTSGSMGWKMINDNNAANVFEERMFQLQNALRDQLTSMKGTFSVGLFSYDADNYSGTLEKAAKPLALVESSSVTGIAASGTHSAGNNQDVEWFNGSGARDGETTLSFPYVVTPGGRSSLGDAVNGVWQSSGGQNSNPASGSYDYAGLVGGNKVVKYYATSNNNQTFRLTRQGVASTPDPYLYILNSTGTTVLYSNNDISAPVATCPNGWQLNAGQCRRQVPVNCVTDRWGGQTCDYVWQYQAPTLSGGNINSEISVSLTSGTEYIIVAGTTVAGQAGNFTLSITNNSRGYYYVDTVGSADPQNIAFRFNQVAIPKGATISSAYLDMRASIASASHAIDVRVDQSLAPDPLQGTTIDSGRSWFVQASKLIPAAAVGGTVQIDVKSLLNAKLGQAGWCGGEDLVFMIEAETPPPAPVPNPIVVQAAEGTYAPRLYVTWTHGGTGACYTKTVNVKTGAIGDDVRQRVDGTIDRQDTTIEMGQGSKAGLRFGFIGLPNSLNAQGDSIGLSVTDARLRLTAATNANPGTIYIRAIQEGFAPPFTADPYDLDDRELGATVSWTINNWVFGTEYTSPNLKDIIQPLLEQETWEYHGTIGFIISASSSDSTKFYTFEDANGNSVVRSSGNLYNWANLGTRAPRLTVTASANSPFENGDAYRKDVWDELMGNDYIPSGGTPVAGAYVEAAEYMLGTGSYDSPLDTVGQCQSNTLVLLTDGDDTAWASSRESAFETITGTGCSDRWGCSFDLAESLKEGVQWYDTETLPDDGTRALKTYTIGYGPITTNTTAKQNLTTIANYGDGQFYEAKDATLLAKAFESIIGSISDSGASLSVPGVSVSAFNRFTVLDEVYYSLFKPSTRRNWAGNAKRYSLSGEIRDVNKLPAINNDSTYFEDLAQSWWSPIADGPVVYVGGAAQHISPVNRNLYTYKGANGASLGVTSGPMGERGLDLKTGGIDIIANGSSLTATDLGMGVLGSLPPAQVPARKAKIVEWVQGGTVDAPRQEMGSPLHSSPVLVSYKKVAGDAVSTLFVSTNEGYLHAIDSGEPTRFDASQDKANRGGSEVFAFIPKETLIMAAALEENAVVDRNAPDYQHAYGLDGSWTYWREDGSDGTVNDSSDHVYLYGGMRRGGSMIYGLNVTDTYYGGDNEPKLLFAIGNSIIDGPTPVSGSPDGDVTNFNNIGQTWSEPRFRTINWKGSIRNVLFFGGGHDVKHDDPGYEGTNELGSQVYMVDAASGELLWAKSTKSSIAAGVRPFDRTGDNLIDGLYAVDLQGRVLRFDINSAGSDFTMYEIADLGGSGASNRKFYAEPGVSLLQNYKTGKIDAMIAVSSGYRENPLDKVVQEQFFMVFDRGAFTIDPATGKVPAPSGVIQKADLKVVDAATSVNGLSEDPLDVNGIYQIKGWTFVFDKAIGEKGTGSPLIFGGIIMFTTFTVEESGSSTCTPVIGQTRLYIMDIAGKARTDLFGGEGPFIKDITSGLSSGVQLLDTFNIDTDKNELVLVIDKKIIKLCGDGTCDGDDDKYEEYRCQIVDCEGRDLDRATWTTKSMGAEEGRLD